MNLCDLAEADNAITLEDAVDGFGRAIKLTDPAGFVYDCIGQVNRVGVEIDPETGLTVSGYRLSVTVRYSAVGVDIKSNWICNVSDSSGVEVVGRPTDIMIDKSLGRMTFNLRRGT